MSCTRWDLGAPGTWSQQLLFSLDQPHHSEGKALPVCWPHWVYTLTFLSSLVVFTTGNPKWPTVTHKAWAMRSSQELQGESKTVKICWKLRQRGWGKGKGEGLESGIKLEWMTVLVRGKRRRKREEVGGHMENTDLLQKETFPFTHPQGFSHATQVPWWMFCSTSSFISVKSALTCDNRSSRQAELIW